MKRPARAEAAPVVGTGARQGELLVAEPRPEGFAYREEVIAPEEERELAERFALLPLTPFAFHGFLGRRRLVSFGWRYDYAGRTLRPSDEIPRLLMPLRERAADIAGLPAQSLQQVLVTEYAGRGDRLAPRQAHVRGCRRPVVPGALHAAAAPPTRGRLGPPLDRADAALGLSVAWTVAAGLGAQHPAPGRAALF